MSGTIAVLTALNLEYQAVGKGNHPAAVLAERAITEFDPAAAFFVGVAGSLWPKIKLGDVVVATHVYAYHGGTSEDDGLKARPRVWEAAHAPDQIARHLDRTGEWAGRLTAGTPTPAVHFGPIAAGEVVQDSAVSEHARWIWQHYNAVPGATPVPADRLPAHPRRRTPVHRRPQLPRRRLPRTTAQLPLRRGGRGRGGRDGRPRADPGSSPGERADLHDAGH